MKLRRRRVNPYARPISSGQRQCIIEATIDNLQPYRRGFARSPAGPFFGFRIVKPLIERGTLRVIQQRAGSASMQLSARADA